MPAYPTERGSRDDAGRKCLSVKEVAALLGVSLASAWRLVKSGRLPSYRPTRRYVIDAEDLDRFRAACRTRASRTHVPVSTPPPRPAPAQPGVVDLAKRLVLAELRRAREH